MPLYDIMALYATSILGKLVNKNLIYGTNLSQHRNSLNLIILNCYIQDKLTVSLD